MKKSMEIKKALSTIQWLLISAAVIVFWTAASI